MTPTTHSNNGTAKIEAYRVSVHARIGTLPRHFGPRMTVVEDRVYHFMREFVSEYKGAYWEFYELGNGGFYMAPVCEQVKFRVHSNDFAGTMSGDAAGITVCLFTFSHLSFQLPESENFSRHFHKLREFALNHDEASLILAAID